ncbi:peptide-methionine (R)-S-oxide reductase family protein [Fimicolochytrium jonesii]|uniref:peptide-methionine (R)-S-oxide reductase family protein n=1 Tax=Fimicolochytrium jonesii TaxID=1396493 RepID=UPI0022FF19AA|nr:peptide-methionine (R)-S-oxide reductase family protein [Fimicolochytrium jonesii]KAI8815937.1 chloroplast methionine sulfoxide reductase B2 precursor [Fimicolochytrium jonesii]
MSRYLAPRFIRSTSTTTTTTTHLSFLRPSLLFHHAYLPLRTPATRTMSTVQKSEDEWRAVLNKEQFRVLREKGTEAAGTGEYNKHKADGVYHCAGCNAALYKSTTKFDSGCGWPAFFDAIPGAITRHEDNAYGMQRIEIVCTACGGHLGHVFKGEGFKTPTDERHCVNSVSLKFES